MPCLSIGHIFLMRAGDTSRHLATFREFIKGIKGKIKLPWPKSSRSSAPSDNHKTNSSAEESADIPELPKKSTSSAKTTPGVLTDQTFRIPRERAAISSAEPNNSGSLAGLFRTPADSPVPTIISTSDVRPRLTFRRPSDAFRALRGPLRPTRADLINAESCLGRTIFGPIPAGHRREFFHDQNNIWIWHEAWNEGEHSRQVTVRYEVRPDGVYKKISAGKYFRLEGDELENFRQATHAYLRLVKAHLYSESSSKKRK